jgi:hypothetical protein
MASIVTLFGPNGINTRGKLKTIRNVRIVSDQTANYSGRGATKVYLLNYDFIHESGTVVPSTNVTFGKETTTGLWKFIGDPLNGNAGNNNGVNGYANIGSNFYGSTLTDSNHGLFVIEDHLVFITDPTVTPPLVSPDPGPPPQIPTIP